MIKFTTKPIKELSKEDFKELTKNKEVGISVHALDHLNEPQRKVFKEVILTNTLTKEKPRKIYLQENKRYALYYRKKEGYLKLIIEIDDKRLTIVSFMIVTELPRIQP